MNHKAHTQRNNLSRQSLSIHLIKLILQKLFYLHGFAFVYFCFINLNFIVFLSLFFTRFLRFFIWLLFYVCWSGQTGFFQPFMSFFPSLSNKEPSPKVQFEKRLSDDIPKHQLTIHLIISFLFSEI